MSLLARLVPAGHLLAQLPCISRAVHSVAACADVCSISHQAQAVQLDQPHQPQQLQSGQHSLFHGPDNARRRQLEQPTTSGRPAANACALAGYRSFASSAAVADASMATATVSAPAAAAATAAADGADGADAANGADAAAAITSAPAAAPALEADAAAGTAATAAANGAAAAADTSAAAAAAAAAAASDAAANEADAVAGTAAAAEGDDADAAGTAAATAAVEEAGGAEDVALSEEELRQKEEEERQQEEELRQQEEERRQQQMAEFNELMKVLIQPISRSRAYNGQLSPHMVNVSGHYYIEPSKALASMVQALLVIKNVLKEDGHIYVVENNPLLKPLLHHAAACCTNPNMWFYADKWVPGMLTNYSSQRRLFKVAHQPNRRLFQSRGIRMTNPHCPEPSTLDTTPPRLSWPDKWALFTRSKKRGQAEHLLRMVLQAEDQMQKMQLPGSLRGRAKRLRLLVVLDSTLNPIALSEAQQRNVPTIALVNHVRDLSGITYPVLARDFHPAFVHFFLDWIVKVANVRGGALQVEAEQEGSL